MDERYYRGFLLTLEGINSTNLEHIVAFFGSAQAACGNSLAPWRESGAHSKEEVLGEVQRQFTPAAVAAYREALEAAAVRLVLPSDLEYPEQLTQIADAPGVLYAQGALDVNSINCVAIVGSRRASRYGERVARELAQDLSSMGICVVSGLARGIDTAAHRGALSSGNKLTCGVVGTGLDLSYPKENAALQSEIRESGLLLSEYPLGRPPLPINFPRRNRIISGLARGVVVVEAADRSGTQVTVGYALDQGREVFAVPGSIYSATSKGAHQLIKQGARLVESATDILEELGLFFQQSSPGQDSEEGYSLTLMQQKILDLLEAEPQPFDVLQERAGIPVGTLQGELLHLELIGLVAILPGRNIVRL